MRASLTSVRIAPKKLNVIAKMVRGKSVLVAREMLRRTNKKAARIVETLLNSAIANATFNDKQQQDDLILKTIVVNQAQSYRRGVPMARGRVRPMRKFLSHMEIILGLKDEEEQDGESKKSKSEEKASQKAKKPVKGGVSSTSKTKKTSSSSVSSN